MARYFTSCKTAEEGKTLYRKLVKELHPDSANGNAEEFKKMQSEFEIWWETHKDIHFSQQTGERYTSEKKTTETAKDFMDIIANLSTLSNIEVEICGTWLWITGNTFPVKDQLKSFGCGWSKGKKKWYWTKEDLSQHYKRGKSMKYIRNKYGSEKVQLNPHLALE